MLKSWGCFIATFVKASVIVMMGLILVLYSLYIGGYLEFATQLYPMFSLSIIISILAGMIHAIRLFPVDCDLRPPLNSILIPARVFPSNHSRKAPPAVDV